MFKKYLNIVTTTVTIRKINSLTNKKEDYVNE